MFEPTYYFMSRATGTVGTRSHCLKRHINIFSPHSLTLIQTKGLFLGQLGLQKCLLLLLLGFIFSGFPYTGFSQ